MVPITAPSILSIYLCANEFKLLPACHAITATTKENCLVRSMLAFSDALQTWNILCDCKKSSRDSLPSSWSRDATHLRVPRPLCYFRCCRALSPRHLDNKGSLSCFAMTSDGILKACDIQSKECTFFLCSRNRSSLALSRRDRNGQVIVSGFTN